MGSEATIRYLKARLVVMEEELSEAGKASSEREVKLKEIELRNKQLVEDKVRARTHTHTSTPGQRGLCCGVRMCADGYSAPRLIFV